MGIGYRIKEARENQGLTQTELGRIVGVTGSAITNYENETSHPKAPVMYKLIEALKVDANYLFQDCVKLPKEVSDVTLAEYEHIKKYRFISIHCPEGASVVDAIVDREYSIAGKLREQEMRIVKEFIPSRIISYHQKLASAGTGQVVFDDTLINGIEIPDTPKYKHVSYAIGVNGRSMEPAFYDGDILLIEPTCQIEVGEIGIFIVDGEAYVKKLGKEELISLNRGHPNISLTEYSNCMGRVVDRLNHN